MALEIPLSSLDPFFSFGVSLDDVDFIFSFKWNSRDNRWYFGVYKADGTLIVDGVAIVVNYPILQRFASSDLPEGTLMFIDSSGRDKEAGRFDLGARVKLAYITDEDLV